MTNKNRYFPRVEEPAKEIEKRYGIPYSTAIRWGREKNDMKSQKGFTFDRLATIASIEAEVEERIKKLFTKNELMALWGAFAKSTIPDVELFIPGTMEWGFSEYCDLESMEAMQFGDVEDLKKSVAEKLKQLCRFERFVLLEYLCRD